MNSAQIVSWFNKTRFYSGVLVLYGLTLLFMVNAFWPALLRRPSAVVAQENPSNTTVIRPAADPIVEKEIITGHPIRVVVPRLGIDLPLKNGEYNPATGTWTLIDGRKEAYFAMPSVLANDYGGNTFVYGHNNRFVFGALKNLVPGDVAQLYTDNKLIFTYTYQSGKELKPNETSIFDYKGPPQLTLQTCTGNWYELRYLHTFKFESVKASDV